MATYKITGIRVVTPSAKMLDKHPERFATIFGVFHNEKNVPLTITSKVITREDALSSEFSIDIAKGILTLPEGQRGRKESPSLSQDDINKQLDALRN